jgi:hypothetical protein
LLSRRKAIKKSIGRVLERYRKYRNYGKTALGMSLFAYAQEDSASIVDKLHLSMEFNASIVSADTDGVDSILWNGIDLCAVWTGIKGISISTHNNISFAKCAENEWMYLLTDGSFLSLYNAIGITKELNENFSINAEIANILSKTDNGSTGTIDFNNFWVEGKLISHVSANAEFSAGLKVDVTNNTATGAYGDVDDMLTVFSIPIGIKISF